MEDFEHSRVWISLGEGFAKGYSLQSLVCLELDRLLSDGGFWFELVSAKGRIGKRLRREIERVLHGPR